MTDPKDPYNWPHPRGYVAKRAPQPPPLTGKVDGIWDAVPWSEPFLDIEGPGKPAPRFLTRVKMMWDDEALYVAAWMEEPQPWANLTLHDSVIYKDNDFEVFIDPDGDNHQYYEFEVNALNAWWDLFLVKPYRDSGPALMSFESIAPSEPTQRDGPTGWEPVKRAVFVDGRVNDPNVTSKGWGVEVAFPWSLLKQAAHRTTPPEPGDQWRINFSRVQYHVVWDPVQQQYVKEPTDQKEDNWVWSPQWEVAMHKPEWWGYVQFSADEPALSALNSSSGGDAMSQMMSERSDQGFVQDPLWPVRAFLMQVYYRQKELWDSEKRFGSSLRELGLPEPSPLQAQRVVVQATEGSFFAAGQLPVLPGGGGKGVVRLAVNEEGRLRSVTALT